jgi:hypothetical protein
MKRHLQKLIARLKLPVAALVLGLALAGGIAMPTGSWVQTASAKSHVTAPDVSPLPQTKANSATFKKGLTIAFSIIGGIAVLMVILGGINYITSSGDPAKAQKAKGTIIYALAGLLVSVLAVAIVQFALGALS